MNRASRFFLGDHRMPISDEKRAVLTVSCLLIWLVTTLYYIISNLISRINTFLLPYYIFLLVIVISLLLCKRGKFSWAKMILLFSGNTLVFIYSSLKPPIPSPFLFFIAGCLMAFALFSWNEKGKAFFFVGYSIFLMLFDAYGDITFVPAVKLSEAYVMKTFFTNLTIVCIVSVLIVYFLVNVNNQVEASLYRQQEETKQKNTELQKINEELDRFIYSASHDLRAPLRSVLGLINLGRLTTNVDELKHYHEMMRERLINLDKILHEILNYSRNNKSELVIEKVNVHELVKRAFADVEYLSESKKIFTEVQVPDNMEIQTDAVRLGIIVNNLVSNAVKYTDLEKQFPKVIVRAQQQDNKLLLTVEDNGEGIEPDSQEKIFSMFYRASTKSDGSGLGLYIVKEAVEKLGGTIKVESKLGSGSIFSVSI